MTDIGTSSSLSVQRPSMQRVVSSTSSIGSSSMAASDTLSAMDEVSMPATPPDVSSVGGIHVVDAITASASASVTPSHPVKKPDLFLSLTRSTRPKLTLSPTAQADFASHIAQSRQRFADDTAYLPKSTNMGLSDVDAAALLSVNPFNYARGNPLSWEDDDVDVDRGRAARAAASKAGKTVFHNAFPCIFVSNLTNSVAFYQKLIGFSPVGKPATHQAVLRRGPAARPPRSAAQQYSAIPSAAEEQGVRIVLRYLPAEWGELKGDGSGPPQLLVVVSNVDELFQEIVAKQQQFKPNGREYFPEVFLGKAKLLGKPQNKPWGTRELHVLDPDANKIVFYHEIN
ncbi:Glyoxalase-like domain protein [Kalmanozyma brasiliensis GHG001]|uniref:Glyoxalase/fosfomycin resistance/dioxygenase domain-containing protein n=1 Tax=Kalmanozyma brasiliensis (strain GHG001) TaxID=1365824 RepID=V5F2K6_KALBG|nr:Glyoxalase-like domain protein [Kalmanozyma brasiliensis GHG001]EST09654.1 Glyoxalase-like domain protein [Kalmanozyma brasiliensis GHG001]